MKARRRGFTTEKMDRIKTRYEEVISLENLIAADEIIRMNSDYSYRVEEFDSDWYNNMYRLHLDLKYYAYIHSGYDEFTTTGADGKVRLIRVCKNYRDRIVQKAIILATKSEMINRLVGNSYSSVPGRGTHKAIRKIKDIVKNRPINVMQLDIYHFFEQMDQSCLINILHNNFKDRSVVWLFERMMAAVDSGVVLGAEDSQWHANLYLTELDHLILETCKPEAYFRYCDDLVLLDESKEKLQEAMMKIEDKIDSLHLQLKPSRRIFRLAEKRRLKGESGNGSGLDFLGYVFYQKHTDLRTRTKNRWRRRLHVLNKIPADMEASKTDIAAYGAITGLLKHCDSKNLLKKWQNEYPNYFERLRRRKAAKVAIAKQHKEELAALLERTKRTGDPGVLGVLGDSGCTGSAGLETGDVECGLCAAAVAE